MNGFFVGGLGNGFIEGFKAVDDYVRGREAKDRADREDTRNEAYRQAQLGLHREQSALARDTQRANEREASARTDILRSGLGLNEREMKLKEDVAPLTRNKAAAEIEEARLKNRASSLLVEQAEAREKMRGLSDRLLDPNQPLSAEDVRLMESAGYPMARFLDGSTQGALKTFREVHDNPALLNDQAMRPKVAEALNVLYPGVWQRGVGEKFKGDDGEYEITGKQFDGVFPLPAESGHRDHLMARLKVKARPVGGGPEIEYYAPLTERGTAAQDDPVVAIPRAYMEQSGAGLATMQALIDNAPGFRERVARALAEGGADDETVKNQVAVEKVRAETTAAQKRGAYYEAAAREKDANARSKEKDGGAKGNTKLGKVVNKDFSEAPVIIDMEAGTMRRPVEVGGAQDNQGALAQVKADFMAKKDREEAKRRLKGLGYE